MLNLNLLAYLKGTDRRPTAGRDCPDRAGELFDRGDNCAQAILQATTGRDDPELLAMAKGFGGGIGGSGCLCGAVSGGVMALGLSGRSGQSRQLIAAFKESFRTTCCRSLSKDYRWQSREHRAHCRQIVCLTAAMVEELLRR